MHKLIDLTGQTFGKLTVIARAENIGKQTAWRCRCSCGNECIVAGGDLKRRQKTCRSCSQTKHGMSKTPIYKDWTGMIKRCENPNTRFYDRYGGRGIKVCERWHDFQNFYADVSILPHFGEKGYSLERRDNDGDYCPENCCWATKKQQANNRGNNIKVKYKGEEMTLMEAAEHSEMNYFVLLARYHKGLRGDELFAPIDERFSHKKFSNSSTSCN